MIISKARSGLIRRNLFAAAFAAVFTAPAGAATIDVTTTDDTIADDGFCSLREAVIAANTNAASTDTTGGCVAGDPVLTVDTINIPAGTYSLTIDPVDAIAVVDPNTYTYGEYTLVWNNTNPLDLNFDVSVTPDTTTGDLDIIESVNLVGAGAGTTIIDGGWVPNGDVNDPDADPDDNGAAATVLDNRIFHIGDDENVDVEMSNLTVMGGRMPEITGLANPDNADEYTLRLSGGGIAVGTGAGTVESLKDDDVDGSKPIIEPGTGGADFTLKLSNVIITQNYAGDGGGLYNAAKTTTADRVIISGNHGYANGGGIYNDGTLTLTDSTIDGNGAEGGGGMFDTGTDNRSISGSTLSNNGAVGGGAYSGRAGVIMNMTNSTVSNNSARDMGAGLLTNGTLNLVHVTVANNETTADTPGAGSGVVLFPSGSATVVMQGVLLNNNFAGNPPTNPADCGIVGSGRSITSSGYNLSQDDTCEFTDTTDRPNVDAMLVALADNGGPTLTHALPADSIAVDGGGMLGAVTTDQRGVARGSMVDIGAYEYVAPVVPPPGGGTGDDDDDGGRCFIATAAYGSYLDPKVKVLRDFRDEYLLTNSPGTELVDFYYRNSPPIADYIRERESLRAVVRALLTAVIYSVEYPVPAMLTLLLIVALVRRGLQARNNANTGSVTA